MIRNVYLTNVRIATLHRDRASFSSPISDGIPWIHEVRVVYVSGRAASFLNCKLRHITHAIVLGCIYISSALLTHAASA